MTLDQMIEDIETQGYSYEIIAEQIGFGKERVKEALSRHEPPWDYNVLIALTHYFEKRDSKQNAVFESMAYHVEKQQGDYTIADYYALPEDWNTELIDGVIYKYNTPTTTHQIIAFQMAYQIEHYIETQEGDCIPFLSPVGVQLDCDEQTMVQPDVIILCNKDKNINHCIYGAPDFVAEVLSPATRHNDLGIKFDKYASAGVREYWIIDPKRAQVIVHLFQKDSDKKVIDDVTIYGFSDQIPVYIYGEKLKIDFAKISRKIETAFPKGGAYDIR